MDRDEQPWPATDLVLPDVRSVTAGDGGTDDLSGFAVVGRYVRIYMTATATGQTGYSLWKVAVSGT